METYHPCQHAKDGLLGDKVIHYPTVLKCRFYYFSGVVKLLGQEMTANERKACFIHRSKKRAMLNYSRDT